MELIECYRGVVHPWQCDAMGHFTTRFYAAMFDDAAYHLLAAVGFSSQHIARGIGFADIRTTTNYLAELNVGDLVVIRGAVVKVGGKSLTASYRMFNLQTGAVSAEMEAVCVQFDLKERRAVQIDPEIRSRIENLG